MADVRHGARGKGGVGQAELEFAVDLDHLVEQLFIVDHQVAEVLHAHPVAQRAV